MSKDMNLVQIEFYFPEGEAEDKSKLANATAERMKETGSIEYCGYLNEDDLKEGLIHNLGSGQVKSVSLKDTQKTTIEKTITNTVEKCHKQLPVPTKNFVFVHPYFPGEEDKVFEGVMAVATFSCVFHLFIDLETFTTESLENTVAHELNHTIYMFHHYEHMGSFNLLDNILMEGLAENFREQYFKPETTAWAGALSEEKALTVLKDTNQELYESTDDKHIREFMFGSSTYKNWNGYSAGYWLIKRFVKENQALSWEEIMSTPREKFLNVLK